MQVTRGMRRRSDKLARHRERLPADALIAGVDLGKRHSVVVFVRASDRARVGRLEISSDPPGRAHLIARGRELVTAQGSGPLVVAMEPTSHFWRPLARAVDDEGVPYVLVQGFVVAHARELDDLTRDKTDTRDAGLIADLAAELRFTETRLPEGPWAESALLVDARDAEENGVQGSAYSVVQRTLGSRTAFTSSMRPTGVVVGARRMRSGSSCAS